MFAYDPGQARDVQGRWSKGGGTGAAYLDMSDEEYYDLAEDWDEGDASDALSRDFRQGSGVPIGEALEAYTTYDYLAINNYMRGKDIPEGYGADPDDDIGAWGSGVDPAVLVEQMEIAFEYAPRLRGNATLYRGTRISAGVAPGDILVDQAFTSTSISRRVAEWHAAGQVAAGENSVLLEIRAPQGQRVLPGIQEDGELVLPAATKMRVVGVHEGAPLSVGSVSGQVTIVVVELFPDTEKTLRQLREERRRPGSVTAGAAFTYDPGQARDKNNQKWVKKGGGVNSAPSRNSTMPYELHPNPGNYTSRELATVAEFLPNMEQTLTEMGARDVMGMKVIVTTSSEAIAGILADGRLKNAHEAGVRGTFENDESYMINRLEIERRLMGIPESAASEDLPIYGWLQREGQRSDATNAYGDIQLVLKDDVKNRTTFTLADSMNNDLSPVQMTEAATAPAEDFLPAGLVDAAILSPLPYSIETYVDSLNYRTYWETQVHGGVELDDIAEVRVTASTSGYAIRMLRESGLKVVVPPEVSAAYDSINAKRAKLGLPPLESPLTASAALPAGYAWEGILAGPTMVTLPGGNSATLDALVSHTNGLILAILAPWIGREAEGLSASEDGHLVDVLEPLAERGRLRVGTPVGLHHHEAEPQGSVVAEHGHPPVGTAEEARHDQAGYAKGGRTVDGGRSCFKGSSHDFSLHLSYPPRRGPMITFTKVRCGRPALAALAYDPGQDRAPKGSENGGEWIRNGGGVGLAEPRVVTLGTAGLARLESPDSPQLAMAAINPSFRSDERAQINCQKAMSAYELRRRGFDVTAGLGCGGKEFTTGMQTWWKTRTGGDVQNSLWAGPQSLARLAKRMDDRQFPPGSRGALVVAWRVGGRHVINWERDDKGGVHLYDAQRGVEVTDDTGFWERALLRGFFRLDDAEYVGMSRAARLMQPEGDGDGEVLASAALAYDPDQPRDARGRWDRVGYGRPNPLTPGKDTGGRERTLPTREEFDMAAYETLEGHGVQVTFGPDPQGTDFSGRLIEDSEYYNDEGDGKPLREESMESYQATLEAALGLDGRSAYNSYVSASEFMEMKSYWESDMAYVSSEDGVSYSNNNLNAAMNNGTKTTSDAIVWRSMSVPPEWAASLKSGDIVDAQYFVSTIDSPSEVGNFGATGEVGGVLPGDVTAVMGIHVPTGTRVIPPPDGGGGNEYIFGPNTRLVVLDNNAELSDGEYRAVEDGEASGLYSPLGTRVDNRVTGRLGETREPAPYLRFALVDPGPSVAPGQDEADDAKAYATAKRERQAVETKAFEIELAKARAKGKDAVAQLLAASAAELAYNPGQKRASKGRSDGGQWLRKGGGGSWSRTGEYLTNYHNWSEGKGQAVRGALNAYDRDGSRINGLLRGQPEIASMPELTQRVRGGLKSVETALREHPYVFSEKTTLYRGARLPDNSGLKVGDVVVDAAFLSTSVDRGEAAESLSDIYTSARTMLEIEVDPGQRALFGALDEGEIVLPRNLKLRVTGYTPRLDGGDPSNWVSHDMAVLRVQVVPAESGMRGRTSSMTTTRPPTGENPPRRTP